MSDTSAVWVHELLSLVLVPTTRSLSDAEHAMNQGGHLNPVGEQTSTSSPWDLQTSTSSTSDLQTSSSSTLPKVLSPPLVAPQTLAKELGLQQAVALSLKVVSASIRPHEDGRGCVTWVVEKIVVVGDALVAWVTVVKGVGICRLPLCLCLGGGACAAGVLLCPLWHHILFSPCWCRTKIIFFHR